MLAVISPAKTLDYARPLPALTPTEPVFAEDAAALAAAAAKLSGKKLAALMRISDTLAKLNVERFRTFPDQPARPAIYAFAGDVYTGFEVRSLDEEAVLYAQDHLRILSGLYGLLRPLDAIRPYRLEMGTRWAPRKVNLYAYWDTRIAARLADDLAESGEATIINVASKEYWGAVADHLPAEARVIEIDFREEGPSGLRFNTFAAKRARGMMARYICEHRIDQAEGVKGFDSDGYAFDPANSDETRWRFTRA
ncbi:peroxide stress protein YaaA [Sphingomonas sp. LY54]|uniref:peroxide stress protein YaaA n=1 Tax=Sphingomonas sp. LY54 TaxID=3095343 RepID=UPI002D77FD65|nr:peroxide stress protein YaaA [Sphingomonas sp. LY54]WRP28907.1 peroxide stress protein YaaA [Sphingomonas sp. LY54]